MSLLSDSTAQVIDASNVSSLGSTYLSPQVTTHFSLMSGVFKQIIGYVIPRDQEYTYVIDSETGLPLQMPQGYVPIAIYTAPLQSLNPSDYFYFYFLESLENQNNYYDIGDWSGEDLNTFTYNEVDQDASGLEYQGLNYIGVYNNNYPTPITTGILKVIVEYF
jgi:hypothetical protein